MTSTRLNLIDDPADYSVVNGVRVNKRLWDLSRDTDYAVDAVQRRIKTLLEDFDFDYNLLQEELKSVTRDRDFG